MPLLRWWAALDRSRRAALGIGALALVLLVVLAATGLGEGGESPVQVAAAPIPTLDPTAAAAVSTAEPSPTIEGFPTLRSLKELKERAGEPPEAKRGRMRIPGIGVDAPIGVRWVPESLEMPAPRGPSDVVLYDFSVRPEFGGMPGTGGNAVFSGHVDYSYKLPWAEANYTGLGVFAMLKTAQPADQVEIEMDGRTFTYAVQWVRTVSAADGDWSALLANDVGVEAITIITCEGAFNPTTQEYADRLVVRAVRTS